MRKPEFVYTTYIEASPERLWQALTDGDFTERCWLGHREAARKERVLAIEGFDGP